MTWPRGGALRERVEHVPASFSGDPTLVRMTGRD
jgi:hypothetical protein